MERLARLEAERATTPAQKVKMPRVPKPKASDPAPPKIGRTAGRVNTIFLTVQQWNRQHPHQTFAITLSLLKDEFGINFRAARDFLEERQNDLWELHQASGVESPQSHNRRDGHDIEALKSFVKEFGQSG